MIPPRDPIVSMEDVALRMHLRALIEILERTSGYLSDDDQRTLEAARRALLR